MSLTVKESLPHEKTDQGNEGRIWRLKRHRAGRPSGSSGDADALTLPPPPLPSQPEVPPLGLRGWTDWLPLLVGINSKIVCRFLEHRDLVWRPHLRFNGAPNLGQKPLPGQAVALRLCGDPDAKGRPAAVLWMQSPFSIAHLFNCRRILCK